MHPEIINLGPLAIRSYGLMLAVSFFLGLLYVNRMAKKQSLDFNRLLVVAYLLIIGGILGARFSYVLFHLEEFSGHWLDSINPFQSGHYGIAGLNLYGGIIGAVILSFIYMKTKSMDILGTFDLLAPTVGLGLIFTRIGCFLNGCCFGTPTDFPWGVVFPEGSIPDHVFGQVHIHPAQLYSSLYGLLLFLYLHWRLKQKTFPGQVLALLFMVEAVFRYAIEYVRYYEDAMHVHMFDMNPTYNQLISISLFILGIVLYTVQKHRHSQPSGNTDI